LEFSPDLIVNLGIAAVICLIVGAIADLIAFAQYRSSLFAYFREWNTTRFGPGRDRFDSSFGFYFVRASTWLYLFSALLASVIYLSE
jgi:hypothetical protein